MSKDLTDKKSVIPSDHWLPWNLKNGLLLPNNGTIHLRFDLTTVLGESVGLFVNFSEKFGVDMSDSNFIIIGLEDFSSKKLQVQSTIFATC